MGVKERRERDREEVRGRILDAARELFATYGYEAVTMRKIAERIEYSPTTIYLYFADKKALVAELCESDFVSFAQRMAKLGKIADPIERLRRLGRAYVDFAESHPNHYRVMFMTRHPPMEGIEEHPHRGNPELDAYAFLRVTVAQAIAEGRLRPEHGDVEMVSQLVWAGMHGVASLHVAKGEERWVEWRPVRDTAARMVEVLLMGLLAPKGGRHG